MCPDEGEADSAGRATGPSARPGVEVQRADGATRVGGGRTGGTVWKIQIVGGSVPAHSEARGRVIASERADIEAAERAANTAGRTLVFVRLVTDTGMSYYHPLAFLRRLTEFADRAIGPECGFLLWTDPGYKQKRKPLRGGAGVDYADGTVALAAGA